MLQTPAWLTALVPGTLPDAGTWALYAILVTAAYTFGTAVVAGQGRPKLLEAARLGAYATSVLTFLGVLLLAYGFVTHDFRIQYVARYSDRSMSTGYLLAALWGGQDGSLLWWLFLLSAYNAACVAWMRGRLRELQPWVIATLMTVFAFFAVLMIFAANPFSVSLAGARPDGEGLNPLLRNYWMMIHPPMLYLGFVGCSVPFAFAVAALITGRVGSEWLVAVRRWMLFAWLFLTIGNTLGMIWAYEVLGWGGFWGWDPVENAACLPWWTASAFLHSAMIQERRDMLKIWNVVLVLVTYLLTIFGTFLTRSGLIASVHSFAKSDIGIYFVWYMVLLIAVGIGLIVWRLPRLFARASIDSVASKEAMFLVNNWLLLGIAAFIGTATTWPLLTETLLAQKSTVGAPFYNTWMAPAGLLLIAMMGFAPVFGWHATSAKALREGLTVPAIGTLLMVLAHVFLGPWLGFPARVEWEPVPVGIAALDGVQRAVWSVFPVIATALVAFNVLVIGQEFARGISARQRSTAKSGEKESVLGSLSNLLFKNQRRYGGYLVHVGLLLMFVGFAGSVWQKVTEVTLSPGQTVTVSGYTLRYDSVRREKDQEKMSIVTELTVSYGGQNLGVIKPALHIYSSGEGMNGTEPGIRRGLQHDVHVAIGGRVDPANKRAAFQVHVNALVSWIWFGLLFTILASAMTLWPRFAPGESRLFVASRYVATVASTAAACVWLAMAPTWAFARPHPPSVALSPVGFTDGAEPRAR